MRFSHKYLLAIALLWRPQIYCAPITPTSGSDVQLAEPLDRPPQVEIKQTGTLTRTPEKQTDIDISVLASPSHLIGDQAITKDSGEDGIEEYCRWLWSTAVWLAVFFVHKVIPFVLFLGACAVTSLAAVVVWINIGLMWLAVLLVPCLVLCCLVVLCMVPRRMSLSPSL